MQRLRKVKREPWFLLHKHKASSKVVLSTYSWSVALEGQTVVNYQLSGFSTFHFEHLPYVKLQDPTMQWCSTQMRSADKQARFCGQFYGVSSCRDLYTETVLCIRRGLLKAEILTTMLELRLDPVESRLVLECKNTTSAHWYLLGETESGAHADCLQYHSLLAC